MDQTNKEPFFETLYFLGAESGFSSTVPTGVPMRNISSKVSESYRPNPSLGLISAAKRLFSFASSNGVMAFVFTSNETAKRRCPKRPRGKKRDSFHIAARDKERIAGKVARTVETLPEKNWEISGDKCKDLRNKWETSGKPMGHRWKMETQVEVGKQVEDKSKSTRARQKQTQDQPKNYGK